MLSVIVMMFFTYMFSGCRLVDNNPLAEFI